MSCLRIMQLGHWPKFQKLHIHYLNPKGVTWAALFSLYVQHFPSYGLIFKITIFVHETWPQAKVPEVAHILSVNSRGSKWSLFSLFEQWFPRYRPISKLPYWAWNMATDQSSRSCTHTLFQPLMGVEIELIFTLWAAVSKIWADFKIAIFGHESWS